MFSSRYLLSKLGAALFMTSFNVLIVLNTFCSGYTKNMKKVDTQISFSRFSLFCKPTELQSSIGLFALIYLV